MALFFGMIGEFKFDVISAAGLSPYTVFVDYIEN